MRLNGYLMSEDKRIAKIENNRIIPSVPQLLPFSLSRAGDFEEWLRGRAIDGHRTNSRLLKKALRLTNSDDVEVVLKVNAATITDTYWFKPEGSNITYNEIRFKQNIFDKLALYGDPDSFNQDYQRTPELTNIGSFEKCWKLENGQWWLYKQGNQNELFSEAFIYYLGKALGFSMAEYQIDGTYIRSVDFTQGASVNFESADGLVGGEEDYSLNFNTIWDLSEKAAKQYIQMIYLDTLCFNMDRHTKNYGVLRDKESGEVIALAPNFDNNIALIARGYPKNIERKNDKLIELFCDFIKSNELARKYFSDMCTAPINSGLISDCIAKTGLNVDNDFICAFILNAYEQIAQEIQFSNTQESGQQHTDHCM